MTIVLDGSSGITAPGGTAAAPSITTTGDVNTGIFFPAADTIAFSEGGVEAMRIDSSGNVGIGTVSPGSKFNVSDASTNCTITVTNSSSNFQVQSNTNDGYFNLNGSGNIIFRSGTPSVTERMRIDSSGNLGLGVTPSAWGSGQKALQTPAGAIWNFNNANMTITQNAFSDGTEKYINNGFASKYNQNSGQHVWSTAASGTAGNAISFTTAMTLDASGNLGIGTTAPANRLHVVGASATPSIRIGSSIVLGAYWDIGRENATSGDFLFMNGSTERARITFGGDLGVGTSSPTTGSLSNTATLNAGLFTTLRGTVASTSGVAVTIGTAISSTNVGYIVSCGVASADPANYCAVAVVSADSGVLRVTALQTAVLMSISVSGTSIRATQSSGGSQTLHFNILRIS